MPRLFLLWVVAIILFELVCTGTDAVALSSSSSTLYLQKQYTEIYTYSDAGPLAQWGVLPFDSASEPIVRVLASNVVAGSLYVQTALSIYSYAMSNGTGTWTEVIPSRTAFPMDANTAVTADSNKGGIVAVNAGLGIVFSCVSVGKCQLVNATNAIPFHGQFRISQAVFVAEHSNMLQMGPGIVMGTDVAGIVAFDLQTKTWSTVLSFPGLGNGHARCLAYDATADVLAVGTADLYWRLDKRQRNIKHTAEYWRFYRVPGLVDLSPNAMEFDENGTLWIVNDAAIDLHFPDLRFERIGFTRGLPVGNLTDIAIRDGSVWVSSFYGGFCYREGRFDYFYSSRWLPGQVLNDGVSAGFHGVSTAAVMVSSGVTVWKKGVSHGKQDAAIGVIATDGGLSIIRYQFWSLADKRDEYNSQMPRHFRFGLVGRTTLGEWGNPQTGVQGSDDNDGLWTCLYFASQIYRYAATGDAEAKTAAWNAFHALQFLNNITGVRGLPARSVLHQTQDPGYGIWYNSSVYEGWIWKGDTSSDELCGHLLVYPLAYQLLAETAEEKKIFATLVFDITSYIANNSYVLLDVTGKPTTWGHWDPKTLNTEKFWYDERNINAMQILVWLASADAMFGNNQHPDIVKDHGMFARHFANLTDNFSYDIQAINSKIEQVNDDNYSDDELLFFPYLTYFISGSRLFDNERWEAGVRRTFAAVRRNACPLWNFIMLTFMPMPKSELGSLHQDAVRTLRNWPLSQVTWPVNNLARKDLHLRLDYPFDINADNAPQSDRLLPYDELGMYRWNQDMFNLAQGYDAAANYEYDPAAWLFPYWYGVYYGLI